MFIMTETGYRPLVSFDAHWTAKREAIANARKSMEAAYALPGPRIGTPDDKTKHNAIMSAGRALEVAYNNFHN